VALLLPHAQAGAALAHARRATAGKALFGGAGQNGSEIAAISGVEHASNV